MTQHWSIALLASTAIAATPLILAALGELVTERAGVLNLGVEGMMLVGAVCGFAVTLGTGHAGLGLLAAAGAGAAMALVFGTLVLTLQASQVATGLALSLAGMGLSAVLGRALEGRSVAPLARLSWLADLPVAGPLLARLDAMVCAAPLAAALLAATLAFTRVGRLLRVAGAAPRRAHAIGLPVLPVRYAAVLFGGAMAGLGGAYLSLAVASAWYPGMSEGRGAIALGLVIFGAWRPRGVLGGAWLFAGVMALQLQVVQAGTGVPHEWLAMLPYLATIAVLVYICRDPHTVLLHKPTLLGVNFKAD